MTSAVPSPVTSASVAGALDVSPAMWAGLAGLVIVMLAADLIAFGRRREPSLARSIAWSLGWIAVALSFGAALWIWQGEQPGTEYLAGYLLERALSLDNIFVFAVIFGYFGVPVTIQPRVLAWGIALALVLRLVLIVAGALLVNSLHATFYAFGLLLLYTGYKLARHEDTEITPEHNPALQMLRRRLRFAAHYDGHRLTVTEAGRRVASPLVAVFVVIATTDIVFAVDSIPAIFAVTTEPFIVFAANAFAMLGLRALYFVLAGMIDRFAYLSYGLAAILGVIGAKMLLIDVWHPPIWLALAAIAGILVVSITLSVGRSTPAVVADSAGS